MKKTLALCFILTVLSATAWGQTAPNAFTTNYRIRQWDSGVNPSADSLNANWALIDTKIRQPGYTIQDSVISTGTALKLGSGDGTDIITIPAKITSFVGIATEGTFGVTAVQDAVASTSQQGDILETAITSSTPTGDYRVSVYLNCDAVVGGTDAVKAYVKWKTSGANLVTDSTSSITLSATSINTHKTFFFRHVGGGATTIKYYTGVTGAAGDGYALHIITERLN